MLIVVYERLEDQKEDSATNVTKCARLERGESSSTTAKKRSSLLWKFCEELMDEDSESETLPVSTQSVVDKYLKQPTQPRKSNPLSYRENKQHNSPLLTALAVRYLYAPPANVASERLFTNICTDLRNHLSTTKVEYLKQNLHTVNYELLISIVSKTSFDFICFWPLSFTSLYPLFFSL